MPDIGVKLKIKDFLTEDKWTKGSFARDKEGLPVAVEDPRACKFCLLGAMQHCYSVPKYPKVLDKLYPILHADPNASASLLIWNDEEERTFAEVKQLLELADV